MNMKLTIDAARKALREATGILQVNVVEAVLEREQRPQ